MDHPQCCKLKNQLERMAGEKHVIAMQIIFCDVTFDRCTNMLVEITKIVSSIARLM